MDYDPNELVESTVRGWPLKGPAAGWFMDLVHGSFGKLRLWMGRGELVRLFEFDGTKTGMEPRGPASVRLRIATEKDVEMPQDDQGEIEFVQEFELDWAELVKTNDHGSADVPRPLVRLPDRQPLPCTSLSFADMVEAFGRPTYEEVFDGQTGLWLHEWLRDGFFVTAETTRGVLNAVGISAIGLGGEPAMRLVPGGD